MSESQATTAEVPSPDPAPAPAPVPAPAPEATTPAQEQIVVAAPVAAAPPQPTLTKELADAVDGIVRDLSGADVSVASLLRFVPRLASLVHTLQIRGAEKRELVMAAAHVLVARVIPEAERSTADGMIDLIFPPAIAAVIDVAAGRVTFQQAVEATATAVASTPQVEVVASSAGNCLRQLVSSCLRKN